MSDDDSSEVHSKTNDEEEEEGEEEQPPSPKRKRGRTTRAYPGGEDSGSEQPATEATPRSIPRRCKKKSFSFQDSGSDEGETYQLPEKKKNKPGRKKGHTLNSGELRSVQTSSVF